MSEMVSMDVLAQINYFVLTFQRILHLAIAACLHHIRHGVNSVIGLEPNSQHVMC